MSPPDSLMSSNKAGDKLGEDIDVTALLYVLDEVEGREAPFVPTPSWLRKHIVEVVKEVMDKHGIQVYYEPGCGDGVVASLVESTLIAKHCVCLEIDPRLAAKAKKRLWLCEVVVGDLNTPPLNTRCVVAYAYLLPRAARSVYENLPEGSILVSLEYKPEGLYKADREVRIEGPFTTHVVYLYKRVTGAQRTSAHRPASAGLTEAPYDTRELAG